MHTITRLREKWVAFGLPRKPEEPEETAPIAPTTKVERIMRLLIPLNSTTSSRVSLARARSYRPYDVCLHRRATPGRSLIE